MILALLLACASPTPAAAPPPMPVAPVPAAAVPAAPEVPTAVTAAPPSAGAALPGGPRILGAFTLGELTEGCSCTWKRDGAWVAHGEVDRSNLVVRWRDAVVTLTGQPEADGEQRFTGTLPDGEPLTATLRTRLTGEVHEEYAASEGVLTVVGPDATEVAPITGGCGC